MFWFGGIFGIVLLVAFGFILLHFADKENSLNLKIAGYLLVASGVIMIISAVIMMFTGSCRSHKQGHHGYGSMKGGCNHHMKMPKMGHGLIKDSTGEK